MLNTKGGRSRGPEVIALRQGRRERRNRDAEDFFFFFLSLPLDYYPNAGGSLNP